MRPLHCPMSSICLLHDSWWSGSFIRHLFAMQNQGISCHPVAGGCSVLGQVAATGNLVQPCMHALLAALKKTRVCRNEPFHDFNQSIQSSIQELRDESSGMPAVVLLKAATEQVLAGHVECSGLLAHRFGWSQIWPGHSLKYCYVVSAEDILIHRRDVEDMPSASEPVGRLRRFVDISVPRNIASDINSLESAAVYNVDDLKEVVAANIEERQKAAAEARDLLREEQQMFEGWRDSLATVPTIKALRNKVTACLRSTV